MTPYQAKRPASDRNPREIRRLGHQHPPSERNVPNEGVRGPRSAIEARSEPWDLWVAPGLAGAQPMMARSVRKPDRESLRTRHQEAPTVNARTWFRKLIPLAIMVLPFVVAACNHGPGGSGGAPGY